MKKRKWYWGWQYAAYASLFMIFAALKLGGAIDWSWWLVCLPLLIPVSIWIVLLLAVGVLYSLGRYYRMKADEMNKETLSGLEALKRDILDK